MKHVAPVRRELGIRTVFNILGPLTNPAGATAQVIGVPRPELAPLLAEALGRLGSSHALVVHGDGGVDELTLSGPSEVNELKDGEVRSYGVSPTDFGLELAPPDAVRGGSAEENAAILRATLAGESGPKRDIVLLNAAAALVAADIAADLAEGVRRAAESIDSGAAKGRLEAFVAVSNSFP
jgi:anthranilate phosphoribosyltransferase